MFTGLVQQVGILIQRRAAADQQTLVIEAALSQRDRALGASVAVSGVCLTVTAATEDRFEVQAAFETLRLTTLGGKPVGARVNLEPALRLGDALGGHLVSGHVDGVGRVRSVQQRGEARELWVSVPLRSHPSGGLARFVAAKGSVTIDGTSLTVNAVDNTGFSVGIIPHTLSATTLGSLAVGDAVNLEVDLLARYVARLLEMGGGAPDDNDAPQTFAPQDEGALREALTEAGWNVRV